MNDAKKEATPVGGLKQFIAFNGNLFAMTTDRIYILSDIMTLGKKYHERIWRAMPFREIK